MKTVIDGSEAGKPIWNSRFEDFAAGMGFVPKVCRVREPQTKGKVERLVSYVKDNFLQGRQFKDLDDLNRQALEWLCERYENGSIILTSNKPFGDWGELMNDTVIATAILDRLLHHAHIINIRGESYRLKSMLKGGIKIAPSADIPV